MKSPRQNLVRKLGGSRSIPNNPVGKCSINTLRASQDPPLLAMAEQKRRLLPSRLTERTRLNEHIPEACEVVDLAYERYGPDASLRGRVKAMVIIHGLLSSSELWSVLARSLAERLQLPVYAINLRNHGLSPHSSQMTYNAMAADVLHFCQKHNLTSVSLVGHSLGAKVAMAAALTQNSATSIVENVVVGDMAPTDRPLDASDSVLLKAMAEIEKIGVRSREEVIEVLKKYTEDRRVIKFIMSNLAAKAPGNRTDLSIPLRFRIPIQTHLESISGLSYFPFKAPGKQWAGDVLLIKAEDSDYLDGAGISTAKLFFPNLRLQTTSGGHWFPFEKPKAFVDMVYEFLNNTNVNAIRADARGDVIEQLCETGV